jgi:uncharacterized protein
MLEKRRGQVTQRFVVYFLGLLIMTLGIVFLIKSNMGATPWDVLHVGLYNHLGLTIGSWSILMGFLILAASALISKEIPHIGAFINMVACGIFIDFYMMLPFMITPDSFFGRLMMFLVGILLNAYGMGLYISAGLGAGPRDSLMIALTNKTGWKVRNVRAAIEVIALIIGWRLGGPANWGTILYGAVIGPMAGFALPQMDKMTSFLLQNWNQKNKNEAVNGSNKTKRGVS